MSTPTIVAPELRNASALLDAIHATGLYPAIQVCVRHRGRIVLHRALGRYRAIDDPAGAWHPVGLDTRFMIFSLSKCLTATAVHILLDRGQLDVDDPVCWHVPEFAARGKEHITLRHLLTHTAGVPMLTWRLTDALIRDWDRIIEQLCRARPLHFPGRMTSYHLLSGGYLLGEVVQRVDGRPLQRFVREEILAPLGFETFNYGISPEWFGRTACSERVEPLPPAPVIAALNQLTQLDLVQTLAVMNRPVIFESTIPSGNVVGTAEETGRFFQMWLDGGQLDGRRVLSERQVHRATSEQVMARFDTTLFFTPQRYSLGFMLGRKHSEFNIFGRHTEQTFGHLGFTRNLGWADPATDISAAFLTSSKVTYPRGEVFLLRQFQDAVRAPYR